MKYNSIREIIGPIMVGPSSSHTAGAVRIGQLARGIYQGHLEAAEIYFYGSFAHTFKGHGTDVAMVAGLLGFQTDDERIPSSLIIAEETGLKVTIIPSNEETTHPNTARIQMHGDRGDFSIVAISIGGGSILITEVDDFRLRIDDDVPTTLVFHWDRSGVIASITEVFGEFQLNIGHMEVSRRERGELSLMSLETDSPVSDEVLEQIRAIPDVCRVIRLQEEIE